MRVPRSLSPLARAGAVASLGCLLLAPTAFAQGRAKAGAADTQAAPVARPSAAPSPSAEPAPTRPTMRKAKEGLRRVDEPAIAPAKTRPSLERVAPSGVATPERGMAPKPGLATMSPAEEMKRKQRAQKFEMEAKRIQTDMASEQRRFATEQQSELARENEKTMAKIRSFAKTEGRRMKIREEAAALEKRAAKASASEARALDEQAAKLLEELEGL